jgi:hypothetical protein
MNVRECDRCEQLHYESESRQVTLEFTDGKGNVMNTKEAVLCRSCRSEAEKEGYL